MGQVTRESNGPLEFVNPDASCCELTHQWCSTTLIFKVFSRIYASQSSARAELVRHWMVLAGSILLLFKLLEISIISTILIVALFYCIISAGKQISRACGLGGHSLGVSFFVGVGCFVFPIQILLRLGLASSTSHWVTFAGLAMVSFLLRRAIGTAEFPANSDSGRELSFALGVAVLAVALRHPWMFPFAICFVVYERLSVKTPFQLRGRFKALLSLAILLGAVVSLAMRPINWWYLYQNGDASFFEAISWSSSEWGVFEHPGAAGDSIAAYHWLSYAFFGAVSQISFLEPWVALMKVGTPITQLLLASLLLPHVPTSKKRFGAISWLVVSFCVTGLSWWRVDSERFGLLAGLALLKLTLSYLQLVVDMAKSPKLLKTKASLPLFVAALVSIMSKSTTGLLLGLVLFLSPVVGSRTRGRTVRPRDFLPFISWLGAGIVAYFILFRGGVAEESLVRGGSGLLEDSSFLQAVNELIPKVQPLVAATVVILLLGFRVRRAAISDREVLRMFFAVLALSPLVLSASPLPNSHFIVNPFYFFVTAISAWLLLIGVERSEAHVPLSRAGISRFTLMALVGLFASLIYRVVLNRLDLAISRSEGRISQIVWEVVYGQGALVGLLFLLGILHYFWRSPWPKNRLLAASLVSLSLVVGGWLDYSRRVHTWGTDLYTFYPLNQAPFPSNSLSAVGAYVRHNTPTNTVLATNDFCCPGMKWWESIVAKLSDTSGAATPSWSELENTWAAELGPAWGGDNYSAAAATRRRFVMLGLGFQTGGVSGPNSDQIARMNLSLQFANSPSSENVNELKEFGASGFLVNLSLTDHRDWSEFAVEKFRSGNFVYLEFK